MAKSLDDLFARLDEIASGIADIRTNFEDSDDEKKRGAIARIDKNLEELRETSSTKNKDGGWFAGLFQ